MFLLVISGRTSSHGEGERLDRGGWEEEREEASINISYNAGRQAGRHGSCMLYTGPDGMGLEQPKTTTLVQKLPPGKNTESNLRMVPCHIAHSTFCRTGGLCRYVVPGPADEGGHDMG